MMNLHSLQNFAWLHHNFQNLQRLLIAACDKEDDMPCDIKDDMLSIVVASSRVKKFNKSIFITDQYDTYVHDGYSSFILPFLMKSLKVIEIVAAHGIVFALVGSGVCATFSRGSWTLDSDEILGTVLEILGSLACKVITCIALVVPDLTVCCNWGPDVAYTSLNFFAECHENEEVSAFLHQICGFLEHYAQGWVYFLNCTCYLDHVDIGAGYFGDSVIYKKDMLHYSKEWSFHPNGSPNGLVIENLVAIQVSNFNHAISLYRLGSQLRSSASTNSNKVSSRSHCMKRMSMTCFDAIERRKITNKLWMVDMGGSERVLETKAPGSRF
ncbi:kinesin-like protein KIN-14T isoform X3 [Tanacetum coccineum]